MSTLLAGFHGLTGGEIAGAFSKPEMFVAYDRDLAVSYAGGGAVIAVTYEARNPLVLETPEQCIEAFRESGIDRAPMTQRWHPDTTHIFAEWARRRGHDAVCLPESAFAGELGYEWVAGTFGEPQMILLEPAKVRINAPLPRSG